MLFKNIIKKSKNCLKIPYVRSQKSSFEFICFLQSCFIPLLFIHFFNNYSLTFAQTTADSLSTPATSTVEKGNLTRSAPFRLITCMNGTYHYPVADPDYYWDPYFTSGVSLSFPTYIPSLYVDASAEIGQIDGKKPVTIDIVNASMTVSYHFSIIKDVVGIRPRIGLSNTLIFLKPLKDLTTEDIKEFFGVIENEFGLIGGFAPVVTIQRFYCTMPIYYEIVFSSPKRFMTANISICAGVTF